MYFLVWCWEWFGDLLLNCWCCISCCKLCFVIKWLSPHFHLSMSFALYLRHGCGKRMYYFRGSYRAPRWISYFEGRIARREGYYYRGSCRAPRQMHGQICPHRSRTEWQRVCITRSDMHHYTWHCIPLHCTYLSLVNLISCFADLLIAFLWKLWLINIELVIADI